MNIPEEPTPEPSEALRPEGVDALSDLEAKYRAPLERFCARYVGPSESEDAVQEVFVRLLSTQSTPRAFRPWVYRIARNYCLNRRRDAARRVDGQPWPTAYDRAASLSGPLTRAEHVDEQRRVIETLAQLSEAQREVLELRYIDDLSRSEIAGVLELEESVVKSRLYEGMQQLRSRLSN